MQRRQQVLNSVQRPYLYQVLTGKNGLGRSAEVEPLDPVHSKQHSYHYVTTAVQHVRSSGTRGTSLSSPPSALQIWDLHVACRCRKEPAKLRDLVLLG